MYILVLFIQLYRVECKINEDLRLGCDPIRDIIASIVPTYKSMLHRDKKIKDFASAKTLN